MFSICLCFAEYAMLNSYSSGLVFHQVVTACMSSPRLETITPFLPLFLCKLYTFLALLSYYCGNSKSNIYFLSFPNFNRSVQPFFPQTENINVCLESLPDLDAQCNHLMLSETQLQHPCWDCLISRPKFQPCVASYPEIAVGVQKTLSLTLCFNPPWKNTGASWQNFMTLKWNFHIWKETKHEG